MSQDTNTQFACDSCGERPATCFGVYEGAASFGPCCDSCCGHGNEDGWCKPIADMPDTLSALQLAHDRMREALEKIIENSGDPVMESIALSALTPSRAAEEQDR